MKLLLLFALAVPAFCRVPPVPSIITDSYIINGRDAEISEFPHQCSLQFVDTGGHTCGCVLIGANWVLTAAHCTFSGVSAYQARYGTADRTSGGSTITFSALTVHPDFELNPLFGFPNDIAVFETEGSITEGPGVSFIDLARPEHGDFAGDTCQISGWGLTEEGGGGSLPVTLQAADTEVWDTPGCQDVWFQVDGDIHICIGGREVEGACNGDSGGPLTCQAGGNPVVAGLTSWGVAGCLTFFPSVYVRVSHFAEWVDEITGAI